MRPWKRGNLPILRNLFFDTTPKRVSLNTVAIKLSEQKSGPTPSGITPSIYLDYGADEHDCASQGFEICERGMRFTSHWQFALGTQLAVSFTYANSAGPVQRITIEGIIVDCAQTSCKCYNSTLLFLDLPEHLREVVRTAGTRLEANVSSEGESRTIQHKASLN